MQSQKATRLISSWQSELAIPADWIALAQKQGEQDPNRIADDSLAVRTGKVVTARARV